jgi:Na+/H+ antiporter NhaC
MSVIADAYRANGLDGSEWDAFVAAIPYQLYAWLAISMVPLMTLLKFDFGPMAAAEDAIQISGDNSHPSGPEYMKNAGPVLVWLPLLVLGATLFATLSQHGFPFEQVAGSDFRAGLSSAYFLAAVTLVVLITAMEVQPLLVTFAKYIEGMSGMMPIAATLVLAWTLGAVSEQLGTGQYVAEIAREGLPGWLLPATVFLLAAVISFATGSSWGTIIIMMPLAIPAAIATGAPLPLTIGAVLSGGLFGDHSSPVSETTILSSTGAGTSPLQHFRTQLPYAALNGAIAFFCFLLAGRSNIAWIAIVAFALQVALLLLLQSRTSRSLRGRK